MCYNGEDGCAFYSSFMNLFNCFYKWIRWSELDQSMLENKAHSALIVRSIVNYKLKLLNDYVVDELKHNSNLLKFFLI